MFIFMLDLAIQSVNYIPREHFYSYSNSFSFENTCCRRESGWLTTWIIHEFLSLPTVYVAVDVNKCNIRAVKQWEFWRSLTFLSYSCTHQRAHSIRRNGCTQLGSSITSSGTAVLMHLEAALYSGGTAVLIWEQHKVPEEQLYSPGSRFLFRRNSCTHLVAYSPWRSFTSWETAVLTWEKLCKPEEQQYVPGSRFTSWEIAKIPWKQL